jgi:hypothetical protein
VGGQPFTPIPPAVIVIFEMTMLFAALHFPRRVPGQFLSKLPPNEYVPEVSDGKIAIF